MKSDLDVSLHAPDYATDDPVYYYLFSPSNLQPAITESGQHRCHVARRDADLRQLSGNASLITPNPEPGLWELDVMQGATTDGTRFSQTVVGNLAYNQLDPVTETGLPTSASTTVASGSSQTITVMVTNTTNHAGQFQLEGTGNDITGGNTATWLPLASGASGTLTATLSPTAASGTAVSGELSVVDSTDALGGFEPAVGFPDSFSDFHDFSYAYTVG